MFERLLRIEHLARWFCGWARIEPKVGGTFRFGGETCVFLPEGRGWETTIEEGETLRRFAFRWPVQGRATTVAFELEDGSDGGTLLRATHTGVPVSETTCGRVQDAWRACLGNLKSIAEERGESNRPDHTPPAPAEWKLTTLLETAPPRVFSALLDPTQVGLWTSGGVTGNSTQVDPRAGGAYDLGEESPWQIESLEPDRRLILQHSVPSGDLRLTLELEPKSSGTAIYLGATGYREPATASILRDRGRWSDRFVCLKNLIEGGDAGFANAYADQVRET